MGVVRIIKNDGVLYRILLALILLLAGFLSFYAVWKEGYGNEYYAAAVKSMLESFKNFFFVSFDPGGYVSVDKPPVALWIQTVFATVLGFNGWVLILPQALATVISTALIYHLVQRTFGKPAGLLSALIFALTPIVAAVSRTNNMDPMLVMFLLLASWALIIAAEKGSFKLLLLSMGLVGVGFNVKMLQAFAVLPAFYLIYFLSPANKKSKKIMQLAVATVLLLVISLSWATVVDMTPAAQRPYVGSSQTNSVLELALGYNGIERIMPAGSMFSFGLLSGSHTGNAPDASNIGTQSGGPPSGMNIPGDAGMPASGEHPSGFPAGMNNTGMQGMAPNVASSGGMAGMESGPAGPFRLLDQQMAGQISWLLPLAILGFFASFVIIIKNRDENSQRKLSSIYFWGMWMLPMLFYFSISGFFHRYYLITLAPAIAALCGIGLTLMWAEYRKGGNLSYLLPLALALAAATEAFILFRYPGLDNWLVPAICIICFISAAGLVFAHRMGRGWPARHALQLLAIAIAVLLVAPAYWSVTPILYGSNTQMPYAGPELAGGGGMFGMSASNSRGQMPGPGTDQMNTADLTSFLLKNQGNATFLVAVPSAMMAEGLILATGKPVMAVGGFSGSDPILTVGELQKMVENGVVKYYMVMGGPDLSRVSYPGNHSSGNMSAFRNMAGGMFGMGSQGQISDWVEAHGTLVPSSEWLGENADNRSNSTGQGFGMGAYELYDLDGSG